MEKTISFIGAGNMGGALVRGICGILSPKDVTVYAPTKKNTLPLSQETGCVVAETISDAISESEYIVLAMKPQMLPGTLRNMLRDLCSDKIIISIAAGVQIGTIEGILAEAGLENPVVRIMPNTPSEIGKGMLLMAHNSSLEDSDAEAIETMLSSCGMVEITSEKFLDLGSTVMGCSPAFVYMFIEALADGGVKIGLPRAKAQLWAAQAVMGAASMTLESGKHPGELKDAVCSPGGTTIAGVAALENHGFRAAVIAAVEAACKRNEELS